MAESRNLCSSASSQHSQVHIDVNQILDSCRDKDCFEDVRVFLSCTGQEIVERSGSIRIKCASVVGSNISVSPLSFNRGFFQVMIRLYIRCVFEVCTCPGRGTQEVCGIAVIDKTAILFGSEKNVRTFRSAPEGDGFCSMPDFCRGCDSILPSAVLDVADPVVLGTKVVERCKCNCGCCCCVEDIPDYVLGRLDGEQLARENDVNHLLLISFGLFSVLRLEREGQFVVSASEFCVPEKECVFEDTDDPCASFRHMAFPTDQFCARPHHHHEDEGHCGCGR